MPADGTRHSFLHTNGDFGMSRLRAAVQVKNITLHYRCPYPVGALTTLQGAQYQDRFSALRSFCTQRLQSANSRICITDRRLAPRNVAAIVKQGAARHDRHLVAPFHGRRASLMVTLRTRTLGLSTARPARSRVR